ncbi:hypothetical protein GEV33_006390 [Tenebrio molitor]|uniref:Aldehyde dehydrogenase domain-containing protein n=1 Tax=Tenebrio molitor TaxID=7067 RepID=A0A8J6HKL4_TENMO|nr:hypothetical protein GEV33_006390 [Tenebrio molitor]
MGKLKVSNVWINCHGLFSAEASMSPYKTSGNAFFGGNEGFYEYVRVKILKHESILQVCNAEAMEKAISEAKKGQAMWVKLGEFARKKTLQAIAQILETKKNNWGLSEPWLNEWITLIHDYTADHSGKNFAESDGFNVVSLREPRGVIAVETPDQMDGHNKKLIIAALAEGNSVIVLNDVKETTDFYLYVSGLLPKGILLVTPHCQESRKVAALHKELNVYVGEKNNNVFRSLPLKISCKFQVANHENWSEVRNKVTLVKNVWFSKEPNGLSRDDGKRPDGMTLVPWIKGQPLVWDVTVVDTLADSYVLKSSEVSGFAAEMACKRKHSKYSSIISSNYVFKGLAFETLGPWCKEAIDFINVIGNRLIAESGDSKSKKFLFERISLAIQRGNAASIRGTFPDSAILSEIFVL